MAVPPISPTMLARIVPGHALEERTMDPSHTLAAVVSFVVLAGLIGGLARMIWRARDKIAAALRGEVR